MLKVQEGFVFDAQDIREDKHSLQMWVARPCSTLGRAAVHAGRAAAAAPAALLAVLPAAAPPPPAAAHGPLHLGAACARHRHPQAPPPLAPPSRSNYDEYIASVEVSTEFVDDKSRHQRVRYKFTPYQ